MATEHEGQVFDITTEKWIEDPTKDQPDPEPKNDTPDPDEPDNDEPEPKPDPEPKKDADEPDGDEPEPKKDDEPAPTPAEPTEDQLESFIQKKFSKFEIKSSKEIIEALEATDKLAEELETERKKVKEPEFKSEQEKKLFTFLSDFDEKNWGEGMKTAAEIINLDPDKADGKKVLQEAFVLKKKHLSREDAIELFNDQYDERFKLNKEDFDDDALYVKRKRIVDIKLKDEEDEARSFLRTKKEELKAKPEEKKAPEPELSKEVVKKYEGEVDNFFSAKGGFKQFSFPAGADGKAVIKVELDAEKKKILADHMKKYVSRTDMYDKSGKIPNFDASEVAIQLTHLLWKENGIPWITNQILKQVDTLAQVKKAEDIGKTKPDKQAKAKGDVSLKDMDPEDQMRVLAERNKKN